MAKRFNAEISDSAFENLKSLQNYEKSADIEILKKQLGLKRKPRTSLFKEADHNGRIYPNGIAPVIVWENRNRVIKPMRYRVRPAGSKEEIPTQYNVFNARLDSLEKRKTWKSLFMKQHALFPFVKFYEWVEDEGGRKQLIVFQPEKKEIMWAPALFDTWTSKDGLVHFDSFALITDDPPPEVAAQGHDRCPVFLKESNIDSWLQPEHLNKENAYLLLKNLEPVYFKHSLAS
ncbi:MAG: SOS response-associated peptidase family protein [Bdellovibrionaceae bacterium]|nr:SOS response-associated peptidase family protein [Pseudobdellovibrionaceae bacterium]